MARRRRSVSKVKNANLSATIIRDAREIDNNDLIRNHELH